MLKIFEENNQGRDFICSDIHGHFHLLEAKLNKIHFDERKDRVFSLGDLIDRGEDSYKVLDWLKKPWFHAIQGNHERMLINAIDSNSDEIWQQWLLWGGDWTKSYIKEELTPFYTALSQLPIAIKLKLSEQKKVGLVHAQLPDQCDWQDIHSLLNTTNNTSPCAIERDPIISDMLWKKGQTNYSIEKILEVDTVKNIDHVFHGHTIVSDYYTLSNRTFMDLGSYATGEIGFIEPNQYLNK